MLFKEAINLFCEKKAIRAERASVSYGDNIRLFQKHINKELSEVEEDDIVKWQTYLKKNKQENTQRIHAISLRQFFKFCEGRGWTTIKWEDIEVTRVREKVPEYVVQPDFEKLCDIAKASDIKLLAIRLLFMTGIRVSELCDIATKDLDLKEMCCYVHTRKAFRPKIISWDTATNDILLKVLAAGKYEYLFASPHGGKLTTRQIQRWVKELKEKAGIEKHVTPHSFRHGFTKENMNINTPLPDLMTMLGHKSLAGLERYTKRMDTDIREKARESLRKRLGTTKFKELEKLLKEVS